MPLDSMKGLEAAGWKTGTAKDFLQLSDEETVLVELKLALTEAVKRVRKKRRGIRRFRST